MRGVYGVWYCMVYYTIVWFGFYFCFGWACVGKFAVKGSLLSFFFNEVSKPTNPAPYIFSCIVNIQIHIRGRYCEVGKIQFNFSALFSRFGWLPSQWNICILRNSSSSSSSRLGRGKVA